MRVYQPILAGSERLKKYRNFRRNKQFQKKISKHIFRPFVQVRLQARSSDKNTFWILAPSTVGLATGLTSIPHSIDAHVCLQKSNNTNQSF